MNLRSLLVVVCTLVLVFNTSMKYEYCLFELCLMLGLTNPVGALCAVVYLLLLLEMSGVAINRLLRGANELSVQR